MTTVTDPAIRRLQLSKLSPQAIQQEAMAEDVDVKAFLNYLNGQLRTDTAERVVDAVINRVIDGASTLKVTVDDWDRTLLRSGLLSNKLDVQVDGLFFRLTTVDLNGDDTLTLTFEDREVAVLREYDLWKVASRSKVTRAEFVNSLIREVKQFEIPVTIPELHVPQPIQRYSADVVGIDAILHKKKGIPLNFNQRSEQDHTHNESPPQGVLRVAGAIATKNQIQNANIILHVADAMGVGRKLRVCAIMVAITESRIVNNPGGDGDSAGVFQQRPSWGTYSERTDVETSARLFFKAAIKENALEPTSDYNTLCADVQRPKEEFRNRYGTHYVEASRFVNAFGDVTNTDTANSQGTNVPLGTQYFFWRGNITDKNQLKIRKRENSWDCIQRLAGEVDWRAFFVSGRFYFMSETDLLKQQPIATIQEFTDGITFKSGNYDNAKKAATIEIEAIVGRWVAPPGSVVVLEDVGPFNGRWIVHEFERSLFQSVATITLNKARPALPEPNPPKGNAADLAAGWVPNSVATAPPTNNDSAPFGGIPNTDGSRQAVVLVAKAALAEEKLYHYKYKAARPFPDSLLSTKAHNPGLDCSSLAILIYKEAGVPDDPSGNSYNGFGNTADLIVHGIARIEPTAGDLVFYGDNISYPAHVAVYIGSGKVIEIGSELGVRELDINYRKDRLAIRSYLIP